MMTIEGGQKDVLLKKAKQLKKKFALLIIPKSVSYVKALSNVFIQHILIAHSRLYM